VRNADIAVLCRCRLDVEDLEMTCMPPVMRRGSTVDKLVYKAGMVAHRALCRTQDARTRTSVSQPVSLLGSSTSHINYWLLPHLSRFTGQLYHTLAAIVGGLFNGVVCVCNCQ